MMELIVVAAIISPILACIIAVQHFELGWPKFKKKEPEKKEKQYNLTLYKCAKCDVRCVNRNMKFCPSCGVQMR